MTIPTQSCVSGFIVSMGSLERTVKGVHFVRARVGVNTLSNGQLDAGPSGSTIYFFLYVYGDAAERVSRRFRPGDVFIASGRVGNAPATGSVFVADHIGHDAKRTTYRVVRTRQRQNQAARWHGVDASETFGPPPTGGAGATVPAPARAI